MKKKDEIILEIADVNFPNKAYGYYEGEKVIVKNAVPGQKVQAQVFKKRGSGVEARLQEVIERSPMERETGMCSHYALCGGCTYQTMRHEEELRLKERQVKRLLENAGICVQSWEGIVPAPSETGYRNKCEFSFGDEEKDGDLALGMRKRMSYYEVVTLKDCNIVDADYLRIIEGTLQFFQERKVPFYHKARHDGSLRHLVVRKGAATGEILINLVTSSEVPFSVEEFKDMLLGLELDGSVCGILHSVNDGLADVVKSDEMRLLYGRDFFMEKLFDLEFKVSVYSFFQTNSAGAEKLYSIVKEFAGDVADKTVFDLYCGTGTIGQIMAEAGSKKVIGIELIEEAVVAANENAKRNHLENCTFLAGDVLKMVDELKERPDLIIVDPPRDGIHPKAIGKIIAFGAPEIVYVSCKPTSLARDLEIFQQEGYQVERVKLMDMFPRTVHVETVVLLSKGEVDSKKIRVEFSLEDMDMSEFQDGATYTQIKDYVLEHSGLKVSNLYISQIKRKCGIEVGKNYNLPKSEDSRQPMCPPEKEKAIREAFKYFGMI
ncbi:23S rRNA (uracil(1939)-C(5))-methyltransferase RlmD [Anaerotignum faecicola]|uniref:23S rRNA (Uracil-5-)-methyltransferase RumA n=1 Tax=Anaerotignum faecicola TaxID=2358141 RepID=A0A401LB00_9FIRM|nr:23S rRNA (uracil(1939)-C(5))-methyltransferase RlmD [Anaerotignum faecicola]GCB28699.1 23S rRNA (uracil-5-)-methyltransferase RumA [Anaerotignum faecicola]